MNEFEEARDKDIVEKQRANFLTSSLSKRLQTENPFDEFQSAVEKAMMEKGKAAPKQFQGDKDFYKPSEDLGMCLSMHQPWASLLIAGFKRFEGREWTHKYRGPLWIHATAQKPQPEEVEQLEAYYTKFY